MSYFCARAAVDIDGCMHKTYIYMLLCQGPSGPIHIKLGVSFSPLSRLARWKAACPMPPQLLAYAPLPTRRRARELECALRLALKPWRNQGDWFRVEMTEKAEFNQAKRVVIDTYRETYTCPINWTHLAVQPLLLMWQRSAALNRQNLRRLGAYRSRPVAKGAAAG